MPELPFERLEENAVPAHFRHGFLAGEILRDGVVEFDGIGITISGLAWQKLAKQGELGGQRFGQRNDFSGADIAAGGFIKTGGGSVWHAGFPIGIPHSGGR